jgi:DNA-binding GntR family transcriptional regulator
VPPDPLNFDRVYHNLKRKIIRGAYSLGARIDAQAVADDVGTSVTPVRDAIQRLIGEGLLEVRPHGGFHAPAVTAPGLCDLYKWNARLAQLASKLPPRATEPLALHLSAAQIDADPDQFATWVGTLFLLLADRSGIQAHHNVVAKLNDALHAARMAEALALKDAVGEINKLVKALDSCRSKAISDRLLAYLQRRKRHILEIVGTVHTFHVD